MATALHCKKKNPDQSNLGLILLLPNQEKKHNNLWKYHNSLLFIIHSFSEFSVSYELKLPPPSADWSKYFGLLEKAFNGIKAKPTCREEPKNRRGRDRLTRLRLTCSVQPPHIKLYRSIRMKNKSIDRTILCAHFKNSSWKRLVQHKRSIQVC